MAILDKSALEQIIELASPKKGINMVENKRFTKSFISQIYLILN